MGDPEPSTVSAGVTGAVFENEPPTNEPFQMTSHANPDSDSANSATHHQRDSEDPLHYAGAAPVDVNQRQSRPSSANRGRERPKSMGHTLHWFACVGHDPDLELDYNDYDEVSSRDGSGCRMSAEERARMVRERQNNERQRKLEELREQALAAQRFRQQKEEERRKRIDEMRLRDTDRRLQVEERKRAIWEAERERREAILRRNEEREARLEGRKRGNSGAGVFAFGSSTPRMLEPADTGGTFWGHRRATSTSNVMFAALPLSRRSSERELDPNKKRATSASGLDRQPGDDYRVSTSMYEVFHWQEFGAQGDPHRPSSIYPHLMGNQEETNAEAMPWSRVARRRTDLVPTIPASRDGTPRGSSAPRPPGRAYSMSRLDQLAQPRRPRPLAPPPPPPPIHSIPPARPPRHRSMGNLAANASHRSVGNLAIASGPSPPPRKHPKPPATQPGSGLRSGEITPASPSRPSSSMSSASTAGGTMTSSISGAITVNRRPRAAPRRPRPASIAGTGVTTPPHVKTNVNIEGKVVGVSDKPPLPKVHTTGLVNNKKTPAASTNQTTPVINSEKPQVPRRTHKPTSQKSPRTTPRVTPLQSPATDFPPSLQEVVESSHNDILEENSNISTSVQQETIKIVKDSNINDDQSSVVVHEENSKEVTKDENGIIEIKSTTIVSETVTVSNANNETNICDMEIENQNKNVDKIDIVTEAIQNLNIGENIKAPIANIIKDEKEVISTDPLDAADMTGSMMARKITTEEEAKAALAERRRLAREEAERQAERERLRLEQEAAEEAERQRLEDERQRKLEEETIRLSELQRQAEEERLQQAILEAQKRAEEEKIRLETEAKAKAEREAAEAKAREEADKQRRETALRLQREEQEREARRKRVEAIMLRTRQSKQKKDDDKSPSEENKNIDDTDPQKSAESIDDQKMSQSQTAIDKESEYEMSVRQREEDLLNHLAQHNQPTGVSQPLVQSFSLKQEVETGINNFAQNGTPSNGSIEQFKDHHQPLDNGVNQTNNYTSQNGHSKNEINNFLNNVALDNTTKQNIVTNNILDIDLLNTANSNNSFIGEVNTNGNMSVQSNVNVANQLIDVSVDSKNLINEDSINSNQPNNSPFIASFQDNQENRDVSLL